MNPTKLRLLELGFGTDYIKLPNKGQLNKISKLPTAFTLESLKAIIPELVTRVEMMEVCKTGLKGYEIKYNVKLSVSKAAVKRRLEAALHDPEVMAAMFEGDALDRIKVKLAKLGFSGRYGTNLTATRMKNIAIGNFTPAIIEANTAEATRNKAVDVIAIEELIAKMCSEDKVTITFDNAVYVELLSILETDGYAKMVTAVAGKIKEATAAFSGFGGFGDFFDANNALSGAGIDEDVIKLLRDKMRKKHGLSTTTVEAPVEEIPKAVPLTIPAIHKRLDKAVIGQTSAKRAIAHSVYVLGLLAAATKSSTTRAIEVPNILLRGPSGCGKTLIASQIAKILKWKLIKVDCSQITATGFHGVSLSDKLEDMDKKVVFLDEIDKLIPKSGDSGSGASTDAVQFELLTFLEKQYSNVNCLFVAAGSFANTKDDLIPELKGRLPVVCELAKPEKADFIQGFKTYHLKKLKAIASLVSPTVETVFKDEIADYVGVLAFVAAMNTPIGYRALDTFTHEISIQLTHDLSIGKEIIVDKAYLIRIFKDNNEKA